MLQRRISACVTLGLTTPAIPFRDWGRVVAWQRGIVKIYFYWHLDTTKHHLGRGSLNWGTARSDWSVAISVGKSLGCWLMCEGWFHCGQCYPWATHVVPRYIGKLAGHDPVSSTNKCNTPLSGEYSTTQSSRIFQTSSEELLPTNGSLWLPAYLLTKAKSNIPQIAKAISNNTGIWAAIKIWEPFPS